MIPWLPIDFQRFQDALYSHYIIYFYSRPESQKQGKNIYNYALALVWYLLVIIKRNSTIMKFLAGKIKSLVKHKDFWVNLYFLMKIIRK